MSKWPEAPTWERGKDVVKNDKKLSSKELKLIEKIILTKKKEEISRILNETKASLEDLKQKLENRLHRWTEKSKKYIRYLKSKLNKLDDSQTPTDNIWEQNWTPTEAGNPKNSTPQKAAEWNPKGEDTATNENEKPKETWWDWDNEVKWENTNPWDGTNDWGDKAPEVANNTIKYFGIEWEAAEKIKKEEEEKVIKILWKYEEMIKWLPQEENLRNAINIKFTEIFKDYNPEKDKNKAILEKELKDSLKQINEYVIPTNVVYKKIKELQKERKKDNEIYLEIFWEEWNLEDKIKDLDKLVEGSELNKEWEFDLDWWDWWNERLLVSNKSSALKKVNESYNLSFLDISTKNEDNGDSSDIPATL